MIPPLLPNYYKLSFKFPPNLFCRGVHINDSISYWRVRQRGNVVSCLLGIGKRKSIIVKEKSRNQNIDFSFILQWYKFYGKHIRRECITDYSVLLSAFLPVQCIMYSNPFYLFLLISCLSFISALSNTLTTNHAFSSKINIGDSSIIELLNRSQISG
jgi:hypothetical protein